VIDEAVSQATFGEWVGITQQAVSHLVRAGVLPEGGTGATWLLRYCRRLREVAAGRAGNSPDSLDLAAERAALAKAQREGIEIKNAALRGEYASIQLLAQVLAAASQAVAERFDHLPGLLRRACPDLPESARRQVMAVIAEARHEWVRSTAELAAPREDADDDDDEQP
jgi:phage terminase Nu1 subunit (DNA packaging protein)